MALYYVLNDDHSVRPALVDEKGGLLPEEIDLVWGREHSRIVAQERVGDAFVSTVFLGLNHQYLSGPPLIFETMVFRDDHGCEMDRYSTWEEAVEGHRRMCDTLTSGLSREELEQSKAIIEALLHSGATK